MRNEENGGPSSLVEKKKTEICERIFDRLLKSPAAIQHSLSHPSFKDQLQAHFNRLPYRYSLDVNVERAEDVVEHKRLLELAKIPENRPAFSVRVIQNSSHLRQSMPLNTRWSMGSLVMPTGKDNLERSSGVSLLNSLPIEDDLFAYGGNSFPWQSGVLPSPSYGSSPNLESLALETNSPLPDNENYSNGGLSSTKLPHKPLHEITFSTMDKPKLLSKLSTVLADVGLNIREAHAFCTVDGYSLDVFVVDGWPTEDTEELEKALACVIANEEKKFWSTLSPFSSPTEQTAMAKLFDMNRFKIPTDGSDDWEIDFSQIKLNHKVASGSFGDLFRGTYCGQEVAIKMLKPECLSEDIQKEFAHEVFIMRKVRHRNVVQFIGACTKVPNLCLVTEFMVGGSVYDYLHKQKRVFNLPTLLRVAIDISRGMDYLHQNNIVHRDLKAANLLMNENEVVKVADFGVARVQTQSGIMTAETGTYRWMAPEVIEHKPYDHKADVFSFGIVLWELITGKLPYDDLTPLQAAVGVVQKGLRPAIPEDTRDGLAVLLERCWQQDPALRPDFSEITAFLQSLLSEKKVRGKTHDEILGRDKIAKKLHVEGEGPCVENKLSMMDCKEHNEDMKREYFVELLNQSSLNNSPPSVESFTPPQNDGLYDEDAKYCMEMRYNKFISSSSFNQFDA